MKKEIKEQIKTLQELADSKRKAANLHWCWRVRDRLQQEAKELEKQADELEKSNKG